MFQNNRRLEAMFDNLICSTDWIANKEKAVVPTYSRELKRMRTKQEQGLVDGRSVAYWVFQRGTRATNFMSNAMRRRVGTST